MKLTKEHVGKLVRQSDWTEYSEVAAVSGGTVWLFTCDHQEVYKYLKITDWVVKEPKLSLTARINAVLKKDGQSPIESWGRFTAIDTVLLEVVKYLDEKENAE